jgi:hypothetical protein
MGRSKKNNHIIQKLVNCIGVTSTAKALNLAKSTINSWYKKDADKFGIGEKTLWKARELLSRLEEVTSLRGRTREVPLFHDFEEDNEKLLPIEAFIYKDERDTPFIE